MFRNLAIVTAAALVAASGAVAQDTATKPAGQPAAKAEAKKKLAVGDRAPALTVEKWVKGEPVTGFEKGKTYVVEFWATWCGPCIASMPHLSALQKEYKDKVTIIGVTTKGLAVLGFGTLEEAIDAVVPLLALKPSAVELLDDMVVGLARANTEYSQYVRLMPPPREGGELAAVLYVEFFADGGAGEIAAKFETLRAMLPRVAPGAGAAYYTGAAEMTQALKLRKAGEPLLHGIPGSRKPLGFVEDNAVPVEKLSEFVREFKRIVASKGTRAAFWAHASVGVLHVRPLLDLRDPADRTRMEEIASEVADLARSLGGVMSGEHGDGRVRGPLLERFFGPELMGAFREVKALFDPLNLLNPGNIVSPGPLASIHETTRVRPAGFDVHAADVDTFFDYTAESGFDHAVEMCNGAGVCRKKLGGTMCPSYMGTLDERHSTRGRGNALRLAVTGQLGEERKPDWNDPETLATLDLCLSCKGCKTECPSNVDIAKYKAEYLAQSYRAAGKTPLKAIAFGRVRGLNKLGSMFAPVSNWVAGSWPARVVMNRMLGIAGERKLPAFAPSLFRLERGRGDAGGAEQPTIVLFADCFTAYNEPRIGSATARVLRSLGYRVVIPDCGCCARSHISTGLLGEAAGVVAGTAKRLFEVVEREKAVAVVVCEPSCLSSIKDDWLRLKLPAGSGVPAGALERLAAISALPEEFIDRYWEAHPTRPAARPGPGEPVLLHGHCHQKALWGADTSARLLRRLVGDRLKVLDTGCCGMAGSFGYGASRYALSMKIGELQLFPALRAEPAAVVVAPGTSCRHQIADGVARRAVHPMELVAELLGV